MKNWLQLIIFILLFTHGILLSADDIDGYPKRQTPNVLLIVNASDNQNLRPSLNTALDSFYQNRRPVTVGLMVSDSEHLAHRLVDITKHKNLNSLQSAVDSIKPDQARFPLDTLLRKAVKILSKQNSACAENHIIIVNNQISETRDTETNNIQIHRIDLGQTNDPLKISSVINNVFNSIIETINNMTTPVIAVNAYNNLQHRSEIYFCLISTRYNITLGWQYQKI